MGSPETRSVEGDPMVWPHPRDAIQYARSSYYYDNTVNFDTSNFKGLSKICRVISSSR